MERVRKNGMKLVLWDINSRDYTGVFLHHNKQDGPEGGTGVHPALSLGSKGDHLCFARNNRPSQEEWI